MPGRGRLKWLVLSGVVLTTTLTACRPEPPVMSTTNLSPHLETQKAVVADLCNAAKPDACFAVAYPQGCVSTLIPVATACAAEPDLAAETNAAKAATAIEACVFRAQADTLGDKRSQVAVCMFQRQKQQTAG